MPADRLEHESEVANGRLVLRLRELTIQPLCEHCDRPRERIIVECISGLPTNLGYDGPNHWVDILPGFQVKELCDGDVQINWHFADGSTKTEIIGKQGVKHGNYGSTERSEEEPFREQRRSSDNGL